MSGIRRSITDLTQVVNSLVADTNEHLTNLSSEISNLKDVVSVLIQAVGPEAFTAKMNELLQNRLKAEEESHLKAIQLLKDRGILVDADTVEGDVMVTGKEEFKDGRVRQVRFELQKLNPEGTASFLGKKVGEQVVDENSTFTVTGIYTVNRDAAKQQSQAELEAAAATVQ